MIRVSEATTIPSPPDTVWPILSDPALVVSCIPGASLAPGGRDGVYQGTMRLKLGPVATTVRGAVAIAYDHRQRRCTVELHRIGRDGRPRLFGAQLVHAGSGANGTETLLSIEGRYEVPRQYAAYAELGGSHVARALVGEFARNLAALVAAQEAAPHGTASASRPGSPPASPARPPARARRQAPPEFRVRGLLWRSLLARLRAMLPDARGRRAGK